MEAHRERPVIRKTGPSAATIVLGVLLVLIGAMVLAFGIGFPMTALPGLGADPRAIMAIVCGIVGGVLIVRRHHMGGGADHRLDAAQG